VGGQEAAVIAEGLVAKEPGGDGDGDGDGDGEKR